MQRKPVVSPAARAWTEVRTELKQRPWVEVRPLVQARLAEARQLIRR